jgi:hypothetical protein
MVTQFTTPREDSSDYPYADCCPNRVGAHSDYGPCNDGWCCTHETWHANEADDPDRSVTAMTDYDELAARYLVGARAEAAEGPLNLGNYGYRHIQEIVESPVAFTNIERLDRIRAVIEAVETVRAERG